MMFDLSACKVARVIGGGDWFGQTVLEIVLIVHFGIH